MGYDFTSFYCSFFASMPGTVLTSGLFGLVHSNRDFSIAGHWGKNEFNSAFPAALACYMASRNINPIFITVDEMDTIIHTEITVEGLFGINPAETEKIFYAFEEPFRPYESLVVGDLPRMDLVIQKILDDSTRIDMVSLEVKLTALPDNSTLGNSDDALGSEIVVRPDTIVYLALQYISQFAENPDKLREIFSVLLRKTFDWSDPSRIISSMPDVFLAVEKLIKSKIVSQRPILMQPIWKTEGASARLHEDCLDMFIWSDRALTRLFFDVAESRTRETLSRHQRSVVWLAKMICDFLENGRINHKRIIDGLTYNTRNDKAFSVNGDITRRYMEGDQLTRPRIKKSEIKNMILGGGHRLLSPERRFDSALMITPDLFD